MISAVKYVLISMSRLFESIDIEMDQIKKVESQRTDLYENMKVTKYKKWTFDNLQDIQNPAIDSVSEDGI